MARSGTGGWGGSVSILLPRASTLAEEPKRKTANAANTTKTERLGFRKISFWLFIGFLPVILLEFQLLKMNAFLTLI